MKPSPDHVEPRAMKLEACAIRMQRMFKLVSFSTRVWWAFFFAAYNYSDIQWKRSEDHLPVLVGVTVGTVGATATKSPRLLNFANSVFRKSRSYSAHHLGVVACIKSKLRSVHSSLFAFLSPPSREDRARCIGSSVHGTCDNVVSDSGCSLVSWI